MSITRPRGPYVDTAVHATRTKADPCGPRRNELTLLVSPYRSVCFLFFLWRQISSCPFPCFIKTCAHSQGQRSALPESALSCGRNTFSKSIYLGRTASPSVYDRAPRDGHPVPAMSPADLLISDIRVFFSPKELATVIDWHKWEENVFFAGTLCDST